GFLGLGNTLASALGPALGLAIIAGLNFRALFAISITALLVALFIARKVSYKRVNQPVYLPGCKKQGFFSLFNADALPASVLILLVSIPYGGVSIFIALYGEYFGLGSGGLFFALMATGTGSTRLFSGQIADKRGEKPMVVLGNSSFLLALLSLLCESSVSYYLSGLFFGFGFGLTFPAMHAMAMRVVPPEKRGSASSTFLCSNDIGSGIGGLLAGWLVTIWGYRPMFSVMIIFIILSWLTYVLWASKTPSAFKNYMRDHENT
ncbi:MAG: MFS transporter, partial [Synergistaceae bacterium]|nr:MFS transporter [Synergistaceae bacterium]